MTHTYTITAYERKDGGFRGVVLNRTTKERQESDVLESLAQAKVWVKQAVWNALPDGAFTIAPIRRKSEYLANVWTR